MFQNREVGGECRVNKSILAAITRANLDDRELIEHIQLRHCPEVNAIHALRIPRHNRVKPATTTRTPRGRAKLAATPPQSLAIRIHELGRERTLPHACRVELKNANDAVNRARRNARSRARPARRRIGRGHKRICTKVNIKHRRLRTLKKERTPFLKPLVQILNRIRHIRHECLRHRTIQTHHIVRIQRLCPECHERAVRFRYLGTHNFREVRLQDVPDAHAVTSDFCRVSRTNPAPRRANLRTLWTRRFLRLINRPMPLHHHVGTLRDMEASPQFKAPTFDLLKFLHQVKGVHHHAITNDAVLTLVQNATRHEVQNILLVAHNDGMTRVRAALEADHNIRLLSQKINDFALTFVAPLSADQYGIHVSRSFLELI